MKLRARLALTGVAVAVVLVAGLLWLDARSRHARAAGALGGTTLRSLVGPGQRERCEASSGPFRAGPPALPRSGGPGPRGGPPPLPPPPPPPEGGPPPLLWAFDESLTARAADAPSLPSGLRESLAVDDVVVLPTPLFGDRVEVVMRTPWGTGPCAYVVARGRTRGGWLGAGLVWLLPLAGTLGAVFLGLGPVIGRLRRLRQEVARSAASGFETAVGVEGRDEIAELAQAFDAASREVRTQLAAREARERALRDFLANTTHDVMIPLTVLLSHLDRLREEGTGDRQALTGAMNEAHYLGALITNLGVAAKLDAGSPEVVPSRVSLDALLDRVLARHRPIAQQRDVSLNDARPETHLFAETDVTFLEQAVSNVVYNAIRHNREGGHVAVILEEAPERRFRLRVIDDGPGIPPDELARLVERGFRGSEARTRAPDGQGLGLNIVQRVAELLGLELAISAGDPGGLVLEISGPLV
jgi:signal transduction histidine kinase